MQSLELEMPVAHPPPACQLYLAIEAGPGAVDRLRAALDASRASSVLIEPPANGRLTVDLARPLIALAQQRDVAALIADDPDLARTLRADGVHISVGSGSTFEEAREVLGRRYIVGVAAASRHDAMALAEAGADYIAFEPTGVADIASDDESGISSQLDLVQWWGEIFEIPCVALDVAEGEDAHEMAATGADFVGHRIASATPLADIVTAARAVSQAIVAGAIQRRIDERGDSHAR